MPSPSLPTGRRRRFLLAAGTAVLLGGLVVLFTEGLERKREADRLQAMADTLTVLRAAADSCRTGLADAEATFRRFDAEVDSLRESVARYEGLDPEGVPAAEYEAYLETFDRYNASTDEWSFRADSLQALARRCRALVERHNLLADSLRVRLESLADDEGG